MKYLGLLKKQRKDVYYLEYYDNRNFSPFCQHVFRVINQNFGISQTKQGNSGLKGCFSELWETFNLIYIKIRFIVNRRIVS